MSIRYPMAASDRIAFVLDSASPSGVATYIGPLTSDDEQESQVTMRSNSTRTKSKTRWGDLQPRTKRLIIGLSVIDLILRLLAIADLVRREPSEVKGSKRLWMVGLSIISSAGVLPVAYLSIGRRK